jgi:hypothetical protein
MLFAFSTGPDTLAAPPDSAYSMDAPIVGGPWTQWKNAADDDANAVWHRECAALLRPFVKGCYIGESDTVSRPTAATSAFSPENWHRLADLRAKHDPDGVFFNYFDGLLDGKSS